MSTPQVIELYEWSPTDEEEHGRPWELLLRTPSLLAGTVLALLVVGVALLGPLFWSTDPNNENFERLIGPSWAHPMGTDELGRDTFARVIHGAQISLEVAVVAVLIAFALGLLIGVTSARYGRFVEAALMRTVDIMFAFPYLVFVIMVAATLGPSRSSEMLAIGFVLTPAFARVAHSATLAVLAQPFVEAARALGASGPRIILRELLPNIAGPLIAATSVYVSVAIVVEAGLSFLGLGVQPPEASWGNMLSEAQTYMQLAWWMAVFPGAGIAIAVLGFNFLGDGLRDLLDPHARRGR